MRQPCLATYFPQCHPGTFCISLVLKPAIKLKGVSERDTYSSQIETTNLSHFLIQTLAECVSDLPKTETSITTLLGQLTIARDMPMTNRPRGQVRKRRRPRKGETMLSSHPSLLHQVEEVEVAHVSLRRSGGRIHRSRFSFMKRCA